MRSFKMEVLHESSKSSAVFLNFCIGAAESPANARTISTPGVFLPTSCGLVPHLTNDLLPGLPPIEAVCIPIESIFSTDLFEGRKSSIESNFGFGSFVKFSPVRLYKESKLSVSKGAKITFQTRHERKTMAVADFYERIKALGTDIFVSAADESGQERSFSGKLKAWHHTKEMSQLAIDANIDAALFLPLVCDPSDETFRLQNQFITEHKDKICGYVLDAKIARDFFRAVTKPHNLLSPAKPIVVLGLLDPLEMLRLVSRGSSLFESWYAINEAEDGCALAFSFADPPKDKALTINLWDSSFKNEFRPLVEGCPCIACKRVTRAYIHHLIVADEMLGFVLLVHHNLTQLILFMEQIRDSLREGSFEEKSGAFISHYSRDSQLHPN